MGMKIRKIDPKFSKLFSTVEEVVHSIETEHKGVGTKPLLLLPIIKALKYYANPFGSIHINSTKIADERVIELLKILKESLESTDPCREVYQLEVIADNLLKKHGLTEIFNQRKIEEATAIFNNEAHNTKMRIIGRRRNFKRSIDEAEKLFQDDLLKGHELNIVKIWFETKTTESSRLYFTRALDELEQRNPNIRAFFEAECEKQGIPADDKLSRNQYTLYLVANNWTKLNIENGIGIDAETKLMQRSNAEKNIRSLGALLSAPFRAIFKPVINLAQGKKTVRSMWELNSTIFGAAGGFIAGGIVGSVVPVVGTFIGAIAGAVLGAFIMGPVFAKQSAKGVSSLANANAVNSTSPDKWQISSKREEKLKAKHINVSTVSELLKIFHDKSKELGAKASIPFTKEYDKKQEINDLVKEIKSGKFGSRENRKFLIYGNKVYDIFNTLDEVSVSRNTPTR